MILPIRIRNRRSTHLLHPAGRWITLLAAVTLHWGIAQAQDTIKVTYLSPAVERQFWQDTVSIMQAAAGDLGIDLKVVVSGDANYRLMRDGRQALGTAERPDYFVSGFWRNVTVELLKIAEQRGIKTVLFNAPVADSEKNLIGHPRQTYRNWILHMHPDDITAAFDLTRYLLEDAKKNSPAAPGKRLGVIGLSGNPDATVTISRNLGFRRALRASTGVELLELVHCDWRKDLAEKMTLEYLQAHPQLKIIWTSADSMALGALNAVRQSDKKPGKDIFIGGIDWSLDALRAIHTGEISASMGGHVLEAAWAMVLIYDYHHGIDLTEDPGPEMLTKLEIINTENVEQYLPLLTGTDWKKVDFRQFSKTYNKSLKKYDFSFKAVARQLQPE